MSETTCVPNAHTFTMSRVFWHGHQADVIETFLWLIVHWLSITRVAATWYTVSHFTSHLVALADTCTTESFGKLLTFRRLEIHFLVSGFVVSTALRVKNIAV